MAITVTVVGTPVVSYQGDNYSISATIQLWDGPTTLGEKVITVNGYRYETDDLKASVKGKFQAEIAEWKRQLAKELQLKALLGMLEF